MSWQRAFSGALLAAHLCAPGAGASDYPALVCDGADPDWLLTAAGNSARLNWPVPFDYDVGLVTHALGREWPVALTLVETDQRQTAILIVLEPGTCPAGQSRAHLLTQRGSEAVMLEGCCVLR